MDDKITDKQSLAEPPLDMIKPIIITKAPSIVKKSPSLTDRDSKLKSPEKVQYDSADLPKNTFGSAIN